MAAEWVNSTAVIAIKSLFVTLFIVTALIGNGCVIYSIYKFPQLKTIPNYFVCNLAVADFLFALTGMPMIVVTTIAKEWILGDVMCDISGFLNTLFCTVSIWTLAMISVNRYFAVAKASKIKEIYTEKRTLIIIVGIWIISILIAVPPILGWSEFKPGSNFCTVNGKKHLSYSILLLFMDYLFPMIMLTGLYSRIFMLLHKHEKQMATVSGVNLLKHDNAEATTSVASDSPSLSRKELNQKELNHLTLPKNENIAVYGSTNSINGQPIQIDNVSNTGDYLSPNMPEKSATSTPSLNRKVISNTFKRFFKEARVTKMLLIVVLGFFFCWTPFMVGSILYAFGIKPSQFQLLTFGIVIACLNSVINPIIYAVMNRNFRSSFKTMLVSLKNIFRHES